MNKYFLEGVNSDLNDNNPHGLPGVSGPAGITPEWDQWREGHQAVWGRIKLSMAIAIYNSRAEETRLMGLEMSEWKDLEPHNQDDYLWMAMAAMKELHSFGILNPERVRLAAIVLEKQKCS